MPVLNDWSEPGPNNSCHTCFGDGEIGAFSKEVPEKCTDCDGTGIEGHITCTECDGSGMNPYSEMLTTMVTGPGSVPIAKCDTCNGEGNIPAPDTFA